VRVYEVGPRDGLQNEAGIIATADKRRFIEALLAAGLREIEATSFVRPDRIPQLADADELFPSLPHPAGVRYPVLVANRAGLDRAAAAGADAIAVFTAATDAFAERNIGMSVDRSLEVFGPLLAEAGDRGWWRRAYVSTAFGCPYAGRVEPLRPVDVALGLLDLGADELCFGDTIGVGVPSQVIDLTGLAVAASPSSGSPCTSMTHGARRWPMSRRRSGSACERSTHRPAVPAAAHTPPARPAISPPRTWSTSSTARGTTTVWTSTGCSRRRA
jgi:hydroxymethylglutaryl-CoA lyase